MKMIDLEQGSQFTNCEVVMRYRNPNRNETVVLDPKADDPDLDHILREMQQIGWIYDFEDPKHGCLYFRSESSFGMRQR